MRSKMQILVKLNAFYDGYKGSEEDKLRAMYRTGIESLLWAMGGANSYLDEIMRAGGKEKDEPFENYMDVFCKEQDLNIFCMPYEEIKQRVRG